MRTPSLARQGGYTGRIGRVGWVASDYYIQIYIDDILVLSITTSRQTEVLAAVFELLNDLGILFHPGKCETEPVE